MPDSETPNLLMAPATESDLARPDPVLLIEAGWGIREQIAAVEARRDVVAGELKALNKELADLELKLLTFGPGRIVHPPSGKWVTVVNGSAGTVLPDQFRLKAKEDELRAREIAGENFRDLFAREVFFKPREDFKGLALGLLTPKKAGAIIELCIVPGGVAGARRPYVKWK